VKIYPVFIPHAGCPHRCLFCAQDRSTSNSTFPEVQDVDAWLDSALPLQGDGEIAFYGGSFSMLPVVQQEAFLSTARHYISSGRVGGIRISTRPDALGEKSVTRLKASGVTTVEIGCQSFDNTVLAAAERGHLAADNVASVQRCRNAGMKVGVQLMPGLPGGDAEEAMMSLHDALELQPSFVRIYPALVIAGTGLAEVWASGHYEPWTLDAMVEVCADMLYRCHRADIPVIRLGLQPDPQLEENLLAGPYHPAFGQLVRSRLWCRALLHASSRETQLTVHPDDLSDVLGHCGENRKLLEKSRPAVRLQTDRTVIRGCLRMSGQDLPFTDLSAQGGLHG
jgi:histone acetyltransferase (RNA polymerase elongator complex component)